MLETNVDHASGEVVGHCLNLLLEAGALDAYTTPVQMKKSRPGVIVSVLCRPEDASRLESLLFRETGTLGVRQWTVNRRALPREAVRVATSWGEIAGKVVQTAEGPRFSPEYEACREVAAARQVPLIEVYEAARRAYDSGSK